MKDIYKTIRDFKKLESAINEKSALLDAEVDKEVASLIAKGDKNALWELLTVLPATYRNRNKVIKALL